MKTRLLKKHRQGSQAHNKRSPVQAQEMDNNQKGLTRLEETILALVVREKNINTAMGDEDIIAGAIIKRSLALATLCNNR